VSYIVINSVYQDPVLVFSTGKKKTRLLFYRYNNQGRTRKRKRGNVGLQMSAAELFSG
jgi:hypothetical protein